MYFGSHEDPLFFTEIIQVYVHVLYFCLQHPGPHHIVHQCEQVESTWRWLYNKTILLVKKMMWTVIRLWYRIGAFKSIVYLKGGKGDCEEMNLCFRQIDSPSWSQRFNCLRISKVHTNIQQRWLHQSGFCLFRKVTLVTKSCVRQLFFIIYTRATR